MFQTVPGGATPDFDPGVLGWSNGTGTGGPLMNVGDLTNNSGFAVNLDHTTLGKVTVKGGGDAGLIRAGEKIASITAKADKAFNGGNLVDAVILAPEMGKITAKGDANNFFVLAGADLGDDFAAGIFKKARIAGDKIDPTTDPRFLVA